MKTILLKLAGPLQSWGTDSHFNYRQTDYYPSKSAIIGLIASAFGYRRDECEKIKELETLHFAVRIDSPGFITEDFQTVHSYEYKPNKVLKDKYVTHRFYLEDAVFVVAVGIENNSLAESVSKALQNPYFQLFEGRRSCPVTMDFYLGCFEDDIISVLKKTPWQAPASYKKEGISKLDIYADADLIESDETASLRKDKPISFSYNGHICKYRKEKHTIISINNASPVLEEHDIFGIL